MQGSDITSLNDKFFSYKGKPLVKNNDTIYYGSMLDDYVVMMHVKSHTQEGDSGEKVPNDITVSLMRTAKDISPKDMVVKTAEKVGMYNALEIADIWLTRFASDK